MDRSLDEVISERQVRQRLATSLSPSSKLLHDACPSLEVNAKPYQRGNTRGRRDRRQNNWPRDGVRKVSAIPTPNPPADSDSQSLYKAIETERQNVHRFFYLIPPVSPSVVSATASLSRVNTRRT